MNRLEGIEKNIS